MSPVKVAPESSALSVFRLEKFVFVCVLKEFQVIQSFNGVIVDIFYVKKG